MAQFSDTSTNSGILQQARDMMRVDSTQWSTQKVVNSCNNWLDTIAGYALATDKNFEWDDTNHTKLPIGTTAVISGQSDYSFLTDEQGNKIVTLTSVSLLEIATNKETQLTIINRNEPQYDYQNFGVESGTPTCYDKIADNVVKLDKLPSVADASKYKLKFYFQRTPSYFLATDTTKEPGVSPLLHRGFVVASAYDGALTLGLPNLQALSVEIQKEEKKMETYFSDRNNDLISRMSPRKESNR